MKIIILSLTLMFSFTTLAQTPEKVNDENATICLLKASDNCEINGIEDCAWIYAQARMVDKFPNIFKYIKNIKPQYKIKYVYKPIIFQGYENYGLAHPDGTLEIFLTNDPNENIDTLVHEMTHYISRELFLKGIITENLYIDMHEWTESCVFWQIIQ